MGAPTSPLRPPYIPPLSPQPHPSAANLSLSLSLACALSVSLSLFLPPFLPLPPPLSLCAHVKAAICEPCHSLDICDGAEGGCFNVACLMWHAPGGFRRRPDSRFGSAIAIPRSSVARISRAALCVILMPFALHKRRRNPFVNTIATREAQAGRQQV